MELLKNEEELLMECLMAVILPPVKEKE